MIKAGLQHTISMEVQFAAIGRLEKTVRLGGKELGDARERRPLMYFSFAATAAHIILQFAPGGIEGIANRDVYVLMGSVLARLVAFGPSGFELLRVGSF